MLFILDLKKTLAVLLDNMMERITSLENKVNYIMTNTTALSQASQDRAVIARQVLPMAPEGRPANDTNDAGAQPANVAKPPVQAPLDPRQTRVTNGPVDAKGTACLSVSKALIFRDLNRCQFYHFSY